MSSLPHSLSFTLIKLMNPLQMSLAMLKRGSTANRNTLCFKKTFTPRTFMITV